MSKAFTKNDDDASDAPSFVPRRAPLPPGAPNYVTARGLSLLREELAEQRRKWSQRSEAGSDTERARAAVLHAAALAELEQRIAGAVLVNSAEQPREEVRFGAVLRVLTGAGQERTYRIVGVDESDAKNGAVAFIAPLARALLGKRVGDVVEIKTPGGVDELTLLAIDYE